MKTLTKRSRPAFFNACAALVSAVSLDAQAQLWTQFPPEIEAACEAEIQAARTEIDATSAAWREAETELMEENMLRSQLPAQVHQLTRRIVGEFRQNLSALDRARLQDFPRNHAAIMALNGGRRNYSSPAGVGGDLSDHAGSFLMGIFNRPTDPIRTTLQRALQSATGREPTSEAVPYRSFWFEYPFRSTDTRGVSREITSRVSVFFSGRRGTPTLRIDAIFDLAQDTGRRLDNFGVRGNTPGGSVPGIYANANLLTGEIEYSGSTILETADFARRASYIYGRQPQPQNLVCSLLTDPRVRSNLPR